MRTEPVDVEVESLHPASLRERVTQRVGRWILRRLQKRVEREWREYEHSPKVSFGPLLPGRRGETQVYRSIVQIHFHPRSRERHPPRRGSDEPK